MTLFLVVALVLLLVLGFPMFIVMLLPSLMALPIYYGHIPDFTLVQRAISGVVPFPLVAIPLFIFAADISMKGQMSKRLINLAEKLVGHKTGGFAQTTVLSSIIFGAVSGSTQATVAAIGSNIYPTMLERGYKRSFTMALVINSSNVAQLIPPSIFMIVYGVITGTSIAALFIAGLIPGITLGLGYMMYSWWWAKKYKIPRTERATVKEIGKAAKEALGPLGFILIIIGGIYGGIFTPTEAAAAAVAYSMFLELIIYRALRIRDIGRIALGSSVTMAMLLILVGGSEAFIWLLTVARVPHEVTTLLHNINPSPILFLLIINVVFFLVLMVFNPISAMIVLTPLLMPMAQHLGIDPVHLGILITLNAAIGSATPPFGVDIFTACAIFRQPYHVVISGVTPFIAIGVGVLVFLTFTEDLVLFLPRLLASY
ncbi:MAG: TRAP transporter large permease [Proteobacteria bacterium]|nr:MAG: TRAP transporter large permease [Pseudomonadota bacterium]